MEKISMYRLNYSVDERKTGVAGKQINDFLDPKNDSVKRTDKYQDVYYEFLDDDLDLKKFSADEEAKPTDLVSSTYLGKNGFFISGAFVELLKQFKVCSYKYRDVYIENLSEKKDYYFLNLIGCPNINFKESSFIIENKVAEEQAGEVKLSSLQDYRNHINKLQSDKGFGFTITPQKIVLSDVADLFRFEISGECLVSEKLKEALKKSKLTGYTLEPFEIKFYH